MSDGKMSFTDHLEELRSRLMRAAFAVMLGMVVVWNFREPFFACGAARPFLGIRRIDLDRAVDGLSVEVARDEPGADTLDRMRRRLPARNDR